MAKKKEWILVEAVSMFRMRYLVEVEDSIGEARLKVINHRVKEFSQEHLDEVITSAKPIALKDALKLCNEDNTYSKRWTKEHKIKTFFTKADEEYYGD